MRRMQIDANGIKLEYEATGDRGAPPILLVMGWARSSPAGRSRFTARSPTPVPRDPVRQPRCRLSTKIERAGAPPLARAALRAAVGLSVQAPYDLDDLAADAVGLLDALGLASAHIVGASMGGMIGQVLAARHGAACARWYRSCRRAATASCRSRTGGSGSR